MAVTVSELFKEYEIDFQRLESEIDRSIAESQEAADGAELQCLKEGERLAGKADQSLRQMEMEAKTLPADQRTALEPSLKRYRADLVERKRVLQEAKDNASRKSLLGDNGTVYGLSMKDRGRAQDATEQMQRDRNRLEEAHRTCLETEQVGIDVMSDLRGQRDVIQRTKNNIREVGEHYGTAKRLLEGMLFRAKVNKYITCAALIFLLVFAVVAAYFFWGRSSSDGDNVAASPATDASAAPSPAADGVGTNGQR